jgi:cell division protein ZapA (FtsZ GTPase activity inhibitor)
MPTVTITLNNKSFKLSCSEVAKPRILHLSSKLDAEIAKVRQDNPYAPFDLLMVMTILNVMDDNEKASFENEDQALKNANKELQSLINRLSAELAEVTKKL